MSLLAARLGSMDGRRHPNLGTAAVFIDLDGFKLINDRIGHGAGDQLLSTVAERLQALVRDGDVVGRIGGDEFLIVCPEIESAAVAMAVARRVRDGLAETVHIGGHDVQTRASIGVAWSLNDGRGSDALVAMADAAMYESKVNGAGVPVLFSPEHLGAAT